MTAVERVEMATRPAPQMCSHGLSDQVDLDGSFVIDGKYMKIKRQFYFCHEHATRGSFAIEEIKPRS